MARLSGVRARLARVRGADGGELARLQERVGRLEQENVELRRHSLRTAELLDIVEELLIPIATRDQGKVDEAVERFRRSL